MGGAREPGVMLLYLVLLLLWSALRSTGAEALCDISEYSCSSGGCVSLSYFCDGVAHCQDYSDEPPGCSVCNRTYYGYVQHTYQLEVPAPPASRAGPPPAPAQPLLLLGGSAPSEGEGSFRCILTFTAAGRNHGHIVQITFAEFHVGHFNTYDSAQGGGVGGTGGGVGCWGDHVTIEEPKLGVRGGRWCGEGSGLNVYYSESDTVVLTLHAASATQGEYFDNPLKFKIKYKFVRREEAVVRYGWGGGDLAKYRGDLVGNSVCSRVFQGCQDRQCRLQSPNFPGLYPRNVTCYYLVKALPAPSPHLLPLVTISQDNDRLVHVGRQGYGGRVSPESLLRQGDECTDPDDFLLVFDGGSMKAPLLAKLCGTAVVPNITSSGPEMLLVFQAAASGRMNHLPNLVAGFELQAHVLLTRQYPNTTSMTSEHCVQTITSFSTARGVVFSPVFAMPANSSCTYELQGTRDESVWIYFTKYYRTRRKQLMMNRVECRNRLAIYDGMTFPESEARNSDLLGEFCDEQQPPICVRPLAKGTVSKPCTLQESFLSASSSLVIRQEFTDSTSLQPLEYAIHYEFVGLSQPGTVPGSDCDRVLTSSDSYRGHFTSPKNIFLYGRGGKSSLSCLYTFKTSTGEAIKLKITSVGFHGNMCKTVHNFQSNLYECIARLPGSAVLEVWEEPWDKTRLPLGCICDTGVPSLTFLSHTRLLKLRFAIRDMNWSQDFDDFFFEAEYEFVKTKQCMYERILNGSTGSIIIHGNNESAECNEYPWKIVARENSHLYLNIPGYHASSQRCSTENRVVVYGSHTARPIKAVCPESDVTDSVQIFSSGWNTALDFTEPRADSLIIRYLAREPARYRLTWLEVRREPQPSALESLKSTRGGHKTGVGAASSCPHQCPWLDACISPELWCDGVKHCPSGADELRTNCLYLTVPWFNVIIGAVAVLGVLFVFIVVLVAIKVHKRGKVKRKKKKEAQRLMTGEVILPLNFHKENIY